MSTSKSIPAAACFFKVADTLHFGRLASPGNDKQNVPVELRARSGQPIDHWYWGQVVHDMAGFRPAAPSIPLDYCHDDNQVLGFLNRFAPSQAGLDCSGQLVLVQDDDRASEVVTKAQAGVPYQASIYFDPGTAVIEEVPSGQSASVNGYQLAGPAVIFRQWMLRGVAVCPYGYDHRTETRLSLGKQAVRVRVLTAEDRQIQRFRLAGLSENLARFAAKTRLPGRRK